MTLSLRDYYQYNDPVGYEKRRDAAYRREERVRKLADHRLAEFRRLGHFPAMTWADEVQVLRAAGLLREGETYKHRMVA